MKEMQLIKDGSTCYKVAIKSLTSRDRSHEVIKAIFDKGITGHFYVYLETDMNVAKEVS